MPLPAGFITEVEDVATGTSKKTILQLVVPSTVRLQIVEFGITFDGTTANTPVMVRIRRQTTAGTASAGTVVKRDSSSSAAAVSSQITFTAEPTDSDILRAWRVSPTSGMVLQWPLGREPVTAVSTWLGVTVTAGATVNATAYFEWEETK